MFSLISSRRSPARIAVAGGAIALVAALMPAPAQAAGNSFGGDAPGALSPAESDTPAPAAPRVEVEQTAVPPVKRSTSPDASGDGNVVAELGETKTTNYRMVGVIWSPEGAPKDVTVQLRTRTGGDWSEWTDLEVEEAEPGEGGNPGTDPLWVGEADGVAARISSATGTPRDIRISTIDPGGDEDVSTASAAPALYSEETDGSGFDVTEAADGSPLHPPKPGIISRSSWGATSGSYCSSPQIGSTSRGVVIHHTAGSNSYSKSQSKSLVRGVQAYHTKSRGWCDIGYNFLIDKYGQIFEGRRGGVDRNVRAAHSGNNEVNSFTMGVSLMGNLDTVKPTSAMKSAAVKLVGWRMAAFYLKTTGTHSLGGRTLSMIAGHRNVVSTGCPGRYGYAWLSENGGLRDRVTSYLSKAETPIKKLAADLGSSTTGLPYVGEYPATGGYKTRFSKMDIYDKAGAGTRYVSDTSGFRASYVSLNAQRSPLGFPRTNTPSARSTVTIQRFEKGSMYAVPSKGVFGIWGPTYSTWGSLKGTRGPLGTPKSSVGAEKNGEIRTNFAGGYIIVDVDSGEATAYSTDGKVLTASRAEAPAVEPPGVVSKPTATGGAESATWSWDALEGATSYQACLVPAVSATRCWSLKSGTGTTVTFDKLFPTKGVDWYVHIRAKNDAGYGSWSPYGGVDLRLRPPAKPTAKATTNSATWSWGAVDGATSYQTCLVPALSARHCTELKTVTGLNVTYDKLVPTGGTDWFVHMRAKRGSEYSPWSPYGGVNLASSAAPASNTTSSSSTVTVPSSRKVSISGHGYGHGIGMSQYGAAGAAQQGLGYAKIIDHYYSGTDLSTKTGSIKVLISADTSDGVLINGQSGLKLRDISGARSISLPTSIGGKTVDRWEIVPASSGSSKSKLTYRTTGGYTSYKHEGSTLTWSGDGYFYGPSTISLILPNGSVMKLRGKVRSSKPSSGSSRRDTINNLTIEDYVRGVIAAEMPSSWHTEALKAQAVAARTYGVRSMGTGRYYDICSTTACQVYGGASRETSRTDAAVKGTAGKIVTYRGAPALTQFSSSSGGYTATGSQPYLKAVSDPYDGWSGNANNSWKITVEASKIEKAYPAIGTLKKMSVTKRTGPGAWGGRVSSLVLSGSRSSVTITGNDARWAFGLRSNWFAF